MKNYTEEQIKKLIESAERTKMTQRRQWVKNLILTQKARIAGITVSDDEIDKYIKAKNS